MADKAYDYDGLWLFWWDQENKTDLYGNYESMAANQENHGAKIHISGKQFGRVFRYADSYVGKKSCNGNICKNPQIRKSCLLQHAEETK